MIKRLQADKNSEIKNMTLDCDRSGSYRNRLNLTDNSYYKQIALKLLRCLFELYEVRHENIWYLEIRNSKHNYEASVDIFVEAQAREMYAMISSQCIKVLYIYWISLFEPLLYNVSVFALNKICDEWIKVSTATLDSHLRPCTGTLRSIIGLPLDSRASNRISGTYLPSTISSQLEELVNTPPIVLENLVTHKLRGRPANTKNKNTRTT
ncbi:2391_t:CDS:2 [Scutellospora calospora]|uniref:2391_t:CDS:1 n=1 Tax=Scutellospora calospora TaxID=85575 RepID=A0ACA9JTX4_9GLOM|nr:2391_t:CDS:2 [Scutellospora calospora]